MTRLPLAALLLLALPASAAETPVAMQPHVLVIINELVASTAPNPSRVGAGQSTVAVSNVTFQVFGTLARCLSMREMVEKRARRTVALGGLFVDCRPQ